jgi:hypothetical protein
VPYDHFELLRAVVVCVEDERGVGEGALYVRKSNEKLAGLKAGWLAHTGSEFLFGNEELQSRTMIMMIRAIWKSF